MSDFENPIDPNWVWSVSQWSSLEDVPPPSITEQDGSVTPFTQRENIQPIMQQNDEARDLNNVNEWNRIVLQEIPPEPPHDIFDNSDLSKEQPKLTDLSGSQKFEGQVEDREGSQGSSLGEFAQMISPQGSMTMPPAPSTGDGSPNQMFATGYAQVTSSLPEPWSNLTRHVQDANLQVSPQAPMANQSGNIVVSTDDSTSTPIGGVQQTSSIGQPVSSSQQIQTFQTAKYVVHGVPVLNTQVEQNSQMAPLYQFVSGSVSQKASNGHVDVPILHDMEGEYGFSVTVDAKERTTKSPMWLMSEITNKLYTNMNKAVPFEIHLKKTVSTGQFHIRAVAVFSSPQFLRTNVTRCPNHASTTDITNHDFPYPGHVVRVDHPDAQYEESSNGRLSVVVPLDTLQDGSEFMPILVRFMCLGSCVGGINRRPIAIVLTLENNCNQTLGRRVIDVRVCACPSRDIRIDEQTIMNKGVKRRGTGQEKTVAPIRKKTKIAVEPKVEPQDREDEVKYIAVKGERLYKFLMAMKEQYYQLHPEYAARYPDDISFQNDEDSEDDLKGSSQKKKKIINSEAITWDTGGGGGYSRKVVIDHENPLEIITTKKNSSPLSKLTPNISITAQGQYSSNRPLKLWHTGGEDQEDTISIEENIDSPSFSNGYGVYLSSTAQESGSSDSPGKFSNTSTEARETGINISKHVPVVQLVKTRSVAGLKVNSNINTRIKDHKRNSKNKKEFISSFSNQEEEAIVTLLDNSFSDKYNMPPGSPEMMAANVLLEGFKAKARP